MIRDWNDDVRPLIMDAWNEGVQGNEDLFDEKSHEDNIRGYFVEPLRRRFAIDGFVVDSPYDRMNSSDMGRVKKKITVHGLIQTVIPDVVIHRRTGNLRADNLLLLEIKKESNRDWPNDVEKLRE